MADNSASNLVKNKLFSKPQRASNLIPFQTDINSRDPTDQIRDGKIQNRIIVKRATAFGFQQANFDLAIERKKEQSNRWHKGHEVPVTVDCEHFKMYGPGIYLFFEFLWKLSLLFLILTLVSLVPMIYNYLQGDRYSNSVSSLDVYVSRLSISNFYGNKPSQNSAQQISSTKVPKLINCAADLLSCFLMMVFYFYWTKKSEKLTEDIKKSFKMPNYYALELKEFPMDASDHEIYNFFNKFGMVTQVAPVKNYSQTIDLSKDIYELEIEIKELKLQEQDDPSTENFKKIFQLEKKVNQLYRELQKQELKSKEDIIKWYICFSTPLERANALKKFNKVYNQFCICCRTVPEDYLLKGQKVSVEACHNQPSQIIWENVHITWKTRWIRALAQFILLLVFVFFGFFAISSLTLVTPRSTLQNIDTSLYNKVSILLETNQTIVESWCLKNKNDVSSTPELSNACQHYVTRYYINLAITYGITVLVIVIKSILKKLVIFIAKFQRYKEHTEQSIDIIKNLVIIYIITTVVIGFLLQADLFGIKFKNVIPKLVNNSTMKINASLLKDYAVPENNWYIDIGYQLWFTWLIMAISPHSYMPFVHYLMECINEWMAKKQRIQKNMDNAVAPAEFEIQDQYANIIMIFLVGFALSGGMPCMIIVTFLGIITRYAYLKFLFIRFSKVPRTFDQHLNETVLSYFPWALGLHFLLSIWMYSVPTIFAFEQSLFSDWYKTSSSTVVQFISKTLGMCIASYYYSLTAAAMMIIILIKQVIYDFFVTVFRKQQDNLEDIQNQDTLNDVAENMQSQKNLTTSYRIENNPNYYEILSIKDKMKKKIQNGEIHSEKDQKI